MMHMKYNCIIVNVNDEEVTVKIGNVYITGFVNSGILKKVGDITIVEVLLYDDLEICKSDIGKASIVRKGNSFSYSLYGRLNVDSCILKSDIDFEIDKEELFDYGYLDGEMVRVDVVRINFNF